jgi:PAS domain S-box-containing protein
LANVEHQLATKLMSENWKLWKPTARRRSACHVLRYGSAVVMVIVAVLLTLTRPVLTETPYIFFLGAVVISAVGAGLGPGFLATALSALAIRLFFIDPRFTLYHRGNIEDAERLCWFVLVALLVSSAVSACRRERNMLRDSEERYRILAETASDAIVVIDEREEILFVNPVAERTFGAPAEKLLGQNLGLLLPDNHYQEHLTDIKKHLDTRKKAVAVQLPGRNLSGGKILLEMTLGAFSKHGKNLFTAILRDVSEHKKVEHVHL